MRPEKEFGKILSRKRSRTSNVKSCKSNKLSINTHQVGLEKNNVLFLKIRVKCYLKRVTR